MEKFIYQKQRHNNNNKDKFDNNNYNDNNKFQEEIVNKITQKKSLTIHEKSSIITLGKTLCIIMKQFIQ